MRKVEYELPESEQPGEKEAIAYLGVSQSLFRTFVKLGYVYERKINNQHKWYPPTCLLATRLRMLAGDLPDLSDVENAEDL